VTRAGPASPPPNGHPPLHAPVQALLQVAQRALGVPVALLALADADHRVAAMSDDTCFSADDPVGKALLSEVVQLDGALLIEDTRAAAPLRGIPVVRGARIMAALALPVRADDGTIVGAVCALDGVPRWWSERDLALLTPLAVAMEALLARQPAPVMAARPEPVVETPRQVPHRSSGLELVAAMAEHREGLVLLDRDWRVRWANAGAAQLLAAPMTDAIDTDARPLLLSAMDETVTAAWRRALASNSSVVNVWRHPVTHRWIEARVSAGIHGLAVLLHDVTEARRARAMQALRARDAEQAETLQVIGQLAGGVAHDFNNLLTVIAANAELLRGSAAPADVAQRELDEIERASTQATDLARQLLAFGQLLPADEAELDVRHWLGRMEGRLRAALPPQVAFESAFDAEQATVHADAELLAEAVVAVARNAADAMSDGGVFRIELSRCALAEPLDAVPDTIPSGAWIVLALHDTGTGITPDALPHVFEPFFTTKGVGRGRGLGLAAVYGIVRQAGGRCSVQSEPGRGTSVSLWLPDRARPADSA
jgi:signal transduction histidine kinase